MLEVSESPVIGAILTLLTTDGDDGWKHGRQRQLTKYGVAPDAGTLGGRP